MQFAKKHLAALAVAGLLLTATAARADQWNKRTVVTIHESIQLPTIVLQPGTYVFKLLDSPADRHIVQVFDKSEQHLLTTVLAINNYRLEPRGKTVLTFWEVPAGMPPALRAWFYPGDNFGQEFAYPKKMSTQIAAANKQAVPTTSAESSEEMKTAAITSTTETGDQNQLDRQAYTAPEKPAEPAPAPPPPAVTEPQQPAPEPQAAPAPAPEPEPVPAPVPSELPHTASSIPLFGLIGAGSLAVFLLLLSRR